jgi:anti-sigma regulatory factor (Ser/Thr protein kinase)
MTARIELPAVMGNLEALMDFVRAASVAAGLDERLENQVALAAEEIIVNVISYAYPDGEPGQIAIETALAEDGIRIAFSDSGIAFDPLAQADPDIDLPVEERGIGGLGIFVAKQTMDALCYARIDGRNVLTLVKRLPAAPG